jgi:hypothetical protein
MKPVTPSEAKEEAAKAIPDEVIQAVNELLIENYDSLITIKQHQVLSRIKKIMGDGTQIDMRWLNFEEAFRKNGWDVAYDSPGFNESYDAYFQFRAKRGQ